MAGRPGKRFRLFSKGKSAGIALTSQPEAQRVPAEDAVTWAYRLLLDREPEEPRGVREKAEHFRDSRALRWELSRSEEFQRKNPGFHLPALSGREPAMAVDEVTDPAALERLLAHVQATWDELGRTEPHWSVLSEEDYRQANLGESQERFYQSGQDDVARLVATLERNGIQPDSVRSCLEYGCGIGRVTRWLAPRFDRLHAFDISPSHLAQAEAYLAGQEIAEVRFGRIAGIADLERLPAVDLIYCNIVLQHNPPPVIALILEAFLAALKPGGVAYFQVPTYHIAYRFDLEAYLADGARAREVEMHYLPQARIFEILRRGGGALLEVIEDPWIGLNQQAVSNTFLVRRGESP